MTRSFEMDYDSDAHVLTLSSIKGVPDWIRVTDDVSVAVDRKKRQLIALRIADFPWFVDYQVISRLLGPEVVTPLSRFQSDVVDRHEKGATRLPAPVRQEERRLVEAGTTMAFLT